VDEALGIGPIPHSRFTEILDLLTSSKTIMALKIITHAQG